MDDITLKGNAMKMAMILAPDEVFRPGTKWILNRKFESGAPLRKGKVVVSKGLCVHEDCVDEKHHITFNAVDRDGYTSEHITYTKDLLPYTGE